jgi:hypothetical protein
MIAVFAPYLQLQTPLVKPNVFLSVAVCSGGGAFMSVDQLKRGILFIRGCGHVLLTLTILSILVLWALQVLALLLDETYDWHAVFSHTLLTLSFAAFFPGQTFWTYRIKDDSGMTVTIIGQAGGQGSR